MKRTLFLICVLLTSLPAFGQTDPGMVDYLGLYYLNIPGFAWTEGAHLEASFRRIPGVLDVKNTSKPRFLPDNGDPIPLSFPQMSRLLFEPDSQKTFDLLGVEGRTKGPEGVEKSFFLVFFADINHKLINLIPKPAPTSPSGNKTPGARDENTDPPQNPPMRGRYQY